MSSNQIKCWQKIMIKCIFGIVKQLNRHIFLYNKLIMLTSRWLIPWHQPPPSLRGGLKIFGKISKGDLENFQKLGGDKFLGGLNDFDQNYN